jgi:undecaprenyl-diphosphatase
MEELNKQFFLLLNAPAHPYPWLLHFAHAIAVWSIWLIPAVLIIGWLRGDYRFRRLMFEASIAGGIGLVINQLIGLFWQHDRPFMIGLGHTFLTHAPDSSFPSDHLTVIWAVAFSLLLHQRPRYAGISLALLGLPVAWARIYLGIHFPLDMVGAALVALISTLLVLHEEQAIAWLYQPIVTLYQLLAAPLIRRGLIQK